MILLIAMTKYVGIAAGVFTGTSLLPQLYKLWKEKKGGNVSIGMLLCLLAGLILWVWYGVLKEDYPIIITNAFSLLVNCAILGLDHYYKKKE